MKIPFIAGMLASAGYAAGFLSAVGQSSPNTAPKTVTVDVAVCRTVAWETEGGHVVVVLDLLLAKEPEGRIAPTPTWAEFKACIGKAAEGSCAGMDLDGDGEVDMIDWASFAAQQ